MHNSYDRLAQLLCEVPEYAVEGRLNKNIVAELARKYDAGLINKLLSDKDMKKLFFSESDAGLIFKKGIFLQFISQKEFLPDSYTAFEQKIGLASGGTMLRNDDRVVLNWPYKDCILEGGQTKEDVKRDEVFFNEVLAPDEINTILEDKVFTNWKRYDRDGKHNLDKLKSDDNLLIEGNNLISLYSLKKRYAGKIRLIYIDPPYNTGKDSFKYNDTFRRSTWLTFMKNRLEVARDLLANNGMIYIQIDYNQAHYLKVLCDEIFGEDNFINEIIWGYRIQGVTKNAWPKKHDNIFLYSKDYRSFIFKSEREIVKYEKPFIDTKAVAPDMSQLSDKDLAYINKQLAARQPLNDKYKERLFNSYYSEVYVRDVWDHDATKPMISGSKEFRDFRTQKPEGLLARIIESATDEGDIVLDFFSGSGTTAATALKMNRRFIALEQINSQVNISLERLVDVINGEQEGISKKVNWKGGGSFVYCNIKNDANKFREKVQHADDKKMDDLLDEVLHSSFLSYRIDAKNHNIKLGDFHKLSLADKKHVLLDLIDNNTLYLNYSEIDDATYKISDEDKKHNKAFYGE